ncbi:hypothetical protein B0H10DRAFT_2210036 [Mycena sp. CBHHK59/15]|nr:hypothetical protein B0H10DRAFT_2210036 [Mycena sp. CBHHK59/15]
MSKTLTIVFKVVVSVGSDHHHLLYTAPPPRVGIRTAAPQPSPNDPWVVYDLDSLTVAAAASASAYVVLGGERSALILITHAPPVIGVLARAVLALPRELPHEHYLRAVPARERQANAPCLCTRV